MDPTVKRVNILAQPVDGELRNPVSVEFEVLKGVTW